MTTTLADIMTTHVVTIDLDTTLRRVEADFDKHPFHHMVVTEHGKPVGIISDRDILEARSPYIGTMSEQTRDTATMQRKVHQIMSRSLISATPATTAADASMLLVKHSIGALPVLDDRGHLVGIVSWRDLLKWFVKDLKPAKKSCGSTRECGSCGACDRAA